MKRIHTPLLIIFLLALIFSVVPDVSALTVSPAKLEISGDAGTQLSGIIKLYNEKDVAQTFYTSYENFEPSDDSGKPKFVGNESGLATWISTTSSVTLAPQERRDVPFTISIPLDVDAGGYFAAIFFGTQAPDLTGGNLSIGGRLGVLTLLRVNGEIPEMGGLLEYGTTENSFFYDMPPVDLEYRFSNDGGDRIAPRGEIDFKNTFGRVRDTIDANPQEGSILPGSARRFNLTWGDEKPKGFFDRAAAQWKNFHMGWYRAEINLGWGFTNQTTTDSVSMIILPWQLLIILAVAFVVIRFVLKFILRRYKASLLRELENKHVSKEDENKE